MKEYLPAVIAFLCGAAMEFANYMITRSALSKGTSAMMILPLRTVIAGGFIAALYFIGRSAGCGMTQLMIGGAAGATVGLFVFTALLMKKNGGLGNG